MYIKIIKMEMETKQELKQTQEKLRKNKLMSKKEIDDLWDYYLKGILITEKFKREHDIKVLRETAKKIYTENMETGLLLMAFNLENKEQGDLNQKFQKAYEDLTPEQEDYMIESGLEDIRNKREGLDI